MDGRLAVHAGSSRRVALAIALAIGLAVIAGPAEAAPRKAEARAAFDRGVKAYKAGDYAAASTALEQSFGIEKDVETLFAWAQAERKLDHCEVAIDLWHQLDQFDLPAKNRAVISEKVDECKALLAKRQPPPPPPPAPVVVAPEPDPVAPPVPERPHHRARWKDPIGLSLVGVGAAGLAVGTVFLVQARSADQAKDRATSYEEFIDHRDTADRKGKIGVIGLAAGGAFVVGGLVWFATRGGDDGERPAVSGWIDGDGGGGLVVAGGF